MAITSLRITDFRNLLEIEMRPAAHGLNIICGNNGSGKTSLLEVIYYLALGRSFRCSTLKSLIRQAAPKFSIVAQVLTDLQYHLPLGVERDLQGATRLRIAEKDASITELAYSLPVRLINSQSHHLFESGPSFRRKFLDWGLFYQFENFLISWRQFERALKQRNAALKERRPKKEVDGWTTEVVKYGKELDQLRRAYIDLLTPFLQETTAALLDMQGLQIMYQPGWEEQQDFASILARTYPEDARLGYTQFGPQRADLELKIQGFPVKHFLSRGQQKLLICAMILAQGMLLARDEKKGLIYLVDDLPSELDLRSRQKLISLLSKQRTQIFITSIESESICNLIEPEFAVPMKVFHVEHGSIVTPQLAD